MVTTTMSYITIQNTKCLDKKKEKRNAFGFITWDFLFNPDNMQFLGATLQISFEIPFFLLNRLLHECRSAIERQKIIFDEIC